MSGSFGRYRLPPGRHGLPRQFVHTNQRWRLLGGCAEAVARSGYPKLTVGAVADSASVSKATFYQHFDSLPDCVLATYEMATRAALAVAEDTCEAAPHSVVALPAAIESLLGLLAVEPGLAYVLTDGALDEIDGLYSVRARFAERCAAMLVVARDEPLGSERKRARCLHRIRATRGWISKFLRSHPSSELPQRAPELAQLLCAE